MEGGKKLGKRKRPANERPRYLPFEPKIIDEFWEYDREGNKLYYGVIVGNGRSITCLRADTKEEAKELARKQMKWYYDNPNLKIAYLERVNYDERKKEERQQKKKEPKRGESKWKKMIREAEEEEFRRNLRRK